MGVGGGGGEGGDGDAAAQHPRGAEISLLLLHCLSTAPDPPSHAHPAARLPTYALPAVRGAYMVLERQRAAEQGYASPIHDTIADTHANYDACVAEMLRCVRDEGGEVMVASHNQRSIEGAVAGMAALGLPPGAGVYFGQLLGMADNLTFTLGAHGYGAYK